MVLNSEYGDTHTSSHLRHDLFLCSILATCCYYTWTSSLLQNILPWKFQILNILLFEHNLCPLQLTCSRLSIELMHTWRPSDHVTIFSLPSVFMHLLSSSDFVVHHCINFLVNILNSLSGLCL